MGVSFLSRNIFVTSGITACYAFELIDMLAANISEFVISEIQWGELQDLLEPDSTWPARVPWVESRVGVRLDKLALHHNAWQSPRASHGRLPSKLVCGLLIATHCNCWSDLSSVRRSLFLGRWSAHLIAVQLHKPSHRHCPAVVPIRCTR